MRKPDDKPEVKRTHTLQMTDRARLELTGVSDVDNFNDQVIVMNTSQGELTVAGRELHISALDLEAGRLSIDGVVIAMEYADSGAQGRRGLWRVFR